MLEKLSRDLLSECGRKLYEILKNKYIVCVDPIRNKKAIVKVVCDFNNFYDHCLIPALDGIFVDNLFIKVLESKNLDTTDPDAFPFCYCEVFDDDNSAKLYYEIGN